MFGFDVQNGKLCEFQSTNDIPFNVDFDFCFNRSLAILFAERIFAALHQGFKIDFIQFVIVGTFSAQPQRQRKIVDTFFSL